MINIEVKLESGNSIKTRINTDLESAKAYYFNCVQYVINEDDFGNELLDEVISVELIPPSEEELLHFITHDNELLRDLDL